MNVFSWLGRRIKLSDRTFWAQFFGGDTWAGEEVSPTGAMELSAFWSGVRLYAETVGSLPICLYEKGENDTRKERTDLPLYKILHNAPNADHTALEFWEGVVTCLMLCGNSFAEKTVSGTKPNERIIALTLLNPQTMTVSRDRNGSGVLKYDYIDQNGRRKSYTEDQIFHVRGFGISGDLGLSPISYGRQVLGLARAADKVAGKTFANGLQGSGWLISKNSLTPGQRELAKQNLLDPMTGTDNAGSTGILEGEFFDYKQLSMHPDDAQLLESRAFSVEEVCRILGVPPVLIGHSAAGQTMWGSGIEQIILGWYALRLRSLLRRIEQAIKRSLMNAQERTTLYAEFTVEELLRADSKARGEFYWKLMQVGAITPNQICAAENYPTYPGGNRHFVNQTLAPLDDNGVPIKTAATSGAGTTPGDPNHTPGDPMPGDSNYVPPAALAYPKLEVVK